ncbi:MAG: ketoacyl-ACP synthase III [Clostridia bacterium]|nr:ketoacyl-ACP synthase III [Clostridia bacterium]
MPYGIRPVGIRGTGISLPKRVLTNRDLEKIVDTSDEWITSRTGIKSRRIADDDVTTSMLASEAAERALRDAGIGADKIGLTIVATITPDMMFPATACLVQDRIGAKNSAAYDLEAGCTGFIYALATGAQFVSSGIYDHVLVIGAETVSRIMDWEDRNTCVLFGDAAGAAVLGPVGEDYGVLGIDLGSDGGGGNLLDLPAGGSLHPADEGTVANKMHYLRMQGNEVFKFAVRTMSESPLRALDIAGLDKKDIDYIVPHQANERIIQAALRRLQLSGDKAYINLDRYGNTSAASVPIALHEAKEEGKVKDGDIVVLVAFGAGLTWGSVVLRWGRGET